MKVPNFGGDEEVSMHFDHLQLDVDGKFYFAGKQGIFVGAEGSIEQDVRGVMTAPSEQGEAGMRISFNADFTVDLK